MGDFVVMLMTEHPGDVIVMLLTGLFVGACVVGAWKVLKRPRPRQTRVPPAWQGDPALSGELAWVEIGRRCPELLGVAADRVLGRPVVDYLLKTLPAVESCSATATAVSSEAVPEEKPKSAGIYFKDGEPTTLGEYPGQSHITDYLMALVDGTEASCAMPREHQLLLGPAGMGKTLLAKCFANGLTLRNARLGLPPVQFIELVPADLSELEQQDEVLRQCMEQPTVLFIDEVHDLKERHALKLYTLLEEGRYRFEGDTALTHIEDLVVVAATTDYGSLHPAVKRRFNRHFLEPLAKPVLREILKRQPFPATEEAVRALVERTHFSGAPWEALQLYRQARVYAKARRSSTVETNDADRVFEAQAVDELGLNRLDRRVMQVLLAQPRYRRGGGQTQEFVCYAASENDVVAMAGIDRGEYREAIKPKLMSRGLLNVRPTYGQALTPKAAQVYGWLVRT